MKPCNRFLWTIALLSLVRGAIAAEPPRPTNTELPNAIGQVSQRLLTEMLNMPVQQTTSVTDNVLGTRVRGSVTTHGKVVAQLVPNTRQGLIHLRFTGSTSSPGMVGHNGPATIFSSSTSTANVWKPVILEELGIRHLPAEGTVNTRISINNVTAKRRFVERIARRRASSSQADARAVTSQHTKVRLAEEINRGAAGPLAKAQDYFLNSFRKPLADRGAAPKLMHFSSTSDHLRVVLQQCSQSRQSPPTSMPQINPQHDMAIALHQSSVCSLYEVFHSGETMHDKDFLQTMHLLTGEDPRPLRVHERTLRWSVTMADKQPLDLNFADGDASIALHLKSVTSGARRYDGTFSVAVRYQFERTANGPRLNRQTDVQVDGQIGNGSPGEPGEAISLLRTKFSAVFQPTLMFDGLAPPTGGIWSKVGQMQLAQLDAQNGWLIVGYQLPHRELLVASTVSMRLP